MTRRVLVTGGAGFIGSAVCRALIAKGDRVLVLDKLTYAGHLSSLASVSVSPLFSFVQGDVADTQTVNAVFADFRPDRVMHLAAESHVDRSIVSAGDFIHTNIIGTWVMLEAALKYWRSLGPADSATFRFLHVSTDEVFGALGESGYFSEETPYDPSSPYSASKAGADHLVSAWGRTYGLPVLISRCSNNYGPYQLPEKLIPLTVVHALQGKPLPVYGAGQNVRDWLHVSDHVTALDTILEHGAPGARYNIGGRNEHRNIDIVRSICSALDTLVPDGAPHDRLITLVTDRPGHDFRYAIDPGRLERDLDWLPQTGFTDGLYSTVKWYVENSSWWEPIVARGRATQGI